MPDEPSPPNKRSRLTIAGILLIAFVCLWFYAEDMLQIETLSQRETALRQSLLLNPLLVYVTAFGTYVLLTGLSIPGAAIMSLFLGWYLGFTTGLVLVSFASTTGATFAFLSSRYLLRDQILERFGEKLDGVNQHLERDGAFYLFTLRLIPAIPFFVVNLLMGLTPIRARTFWWVSQIGMLPGTAAYIYAGSTLPALSEIQKSNRAPIMTAELIAGFVILGILPWLLKLILQLIRIGSSLENDD